MDENSLALSHYAYPKDPEGRRRVDELLRTMIRDVATVTANVANLIKDHTEAFRRVEERLDSIVEKIDEDRNAIIGKIEEDRRSDTQRDKKIDALASAQDAMQKTLDDWKPTVAFTSVWRRVIIYVIPPAVLVFYTAASQDIWNAIKSLFSRR